jgi:hypothetical protein
MLNNAQASSGPTNGQLRSMIVSVPGENFHDDVKVLVTFKSLPTTDPGSKNDSNTDNRILRGISWPFRNCSFSRMSLNAA